MNSGGGTPQRVTSEPGDYVVVPRGTMWRIECGSPVDLLMVEATNSSYHLPDKGMLGPHAIFDPAMLDRVRAMPRRYRSA